MMRARTDHWPLSSSAFDDLANRREVSLIGIGRCGEHAVSLLELAKCELQALRFYLHPHPAQLANGLTRLQPVYVEDVAEAIARVLRRAGLHANTLECGGPRIYSYEELLRIVAHQARLKPLFIPVPFAAWHAMADRRTDNIFVVEQTLTDEPFGRRCRMRKVDDQIQLPIT
jgi:hypothetical protein